MGVGDRGSWALGRAGLWRGHGEVWLLRRDAMYGSRPVLSTVLELDDGLDV
jgi:hypothetical protein